MTDYTIAEDYTLPSLGKVYKQDVNPNIRIRSMTTEEEMKRLGKSDRQYKLLSEIIDDCLIEKPGISAYDMCIGDYQFLLHKLRIVTYGPQYKVGFTCPICGSTNEKTIDLESLDVTTYTEDMDGLLNIILPRTKKRIRLKMQTPRMLDDISIKAKELERKSTNFKGDTAFLFTIESLIFTVDDEVLDPVRLETFVRSLPMQDVNYILKSIQKINIGVETTTTCVCERCGSDFKSLIPISGEFFGPSID